MAKKAEAPKKNTVTRNNELKEEWTHERGIAQALQTLTGHTQSPEAFLISKGIDPPIKAAPVQNITFFQLVELLAEFKNA